MAQKGLGLPGLAYQLPNNSLLLFLVPDDCYNYRPVQWGLLHRLCTCTFVEVVPLNSPPQHPIGKWVDLSCHPYPSKVSLQSSPCPHLSAFS